MERIDLMIVGPERGSTGGVLRYVAEQRRRLPDDVSRRVYDDGSARGSGVSGVVTTALTSAIAALRFPAQRRADVVHVHASHGPSFYRAAWYVLVAGLIWRRPVVVHIHGSGFDDFVSTSGIEGMIQRVVFDVADEVFVLSEYWRTVVSDVAGETEVTVVPNAVDPEEYDPEYGAEVPEIVFVSNHIERKGIVDLVEALERLDRSGLTFTATIAGDGPLSNRAAELAGRSDRMEYRGFVSEVEKRRLLDGADIYVLPTYAEGLPIALLEGMAAGNAVVTTPVASIPEVVDETGGRLVSPGNVDELAESLRELVKDPELVEEMGRRNRTTVERNYSWHVTIEEVLSAYRRLLGNVKSGHGPSIAHPEH